MWTTLFIGASLSLVASMGPGLSPAHARPIVETICDFLGDRAWDAYFAKDYQLVGTIDAAMEAIGCFD